MKKQVSTFTYIKEVLLKEGIKGFYKGLGTGLIGTVVSFGIYFFWYRFFKNLCKHITGRGTFNDLEIMIITVLSGVINSICTNPIWFINTRMSIAKDQKSII